MKKFLASHDLQTVSQLLRFPKYLQIETVSTCNARCVMCPVEEWERDNKLMPDTLFRLIVDELAEHADWIEAVVPQLQGEPLIDKKLEDKISILKENNIRFVEFSTNASLLDVDRGRTLLDSGLDRINFSIDGTTAETFEKLRHRLKFDECVNNILEFVALRNQLGSPLKVRVRMAIQKENRSEFGDFLSFWNRHLAPGDMVYGKHIHNWANWLEDAPSPPDNLRQRLNGRPCISPFTSMVILSDGRVPLCCSDFNSAVELGHINKSSLSEIWNNQIIGPIRESHLSQGRKSMDMCIDCNVWDDGAVVTGTERREDV